MTTAEEVGRGAEGDEAGVTGWAGGGDLHARLRSLDFLMGNKKSEKLPEQQSSTTRRVS